MSAGLVWVKEIWSLSENTQAEEDGNLCLETKKRYDDLHRHLASHYDDDALLYFDNTDKGCLGNSRTRALFWGFVSKIQSFRKALELE